MAEKITPESLLNKASETKTAYHRYMLKKNGTTLFCFTEGIHDPDYYLDKVRCLYGDDFLILDCKGKDKVISMYCKIYQKDKDKQKLAFFVEVLQVFVLVGGNLP